MIALKIFDITLIGVNSRTGKKLLFTLALLTIVFVVRWCALAGVRALGARRVEPTGFWSRQGIQLIRDRDAARCRIDWIDAGTNVTTGLGLFSAGVAFALQQPLTAIAAYFVILRGDMFNVGDRIVMGDVRGDVIRLGFMKTTVMEMGQPPTVGGNADPAVWIHGRQYTGRLVTAVTESSSPTRCSTTPAISRSSGTRSSSRSSSTPTATKSSRALDAMKRRYAVQSVDLQPQVCMRITDNWLELSVRSSFPLEAHEPPRMQWPETSCRVSKPTSYMRFVGSGL